MAPAICQPTTRACAGMAPRQTTSPDSRHSELGQQDRSRRGSGVGDGAETVICHSKKTRAREDGKIALSGELSAPASQRSGHTPPATAWARAHPQIRPHPFRPSHPSTTRTAALQLASSSDPRSTPAKPLSIDTPARSNRRVPPSAGRTAWRTERPPRPARHLSHGSACLSLQDGPQARPE